MLNIDEEELSSGVREVDVEGIALDAVDDILVSFTNNDFAPLYDSLKKDDGPEVQIARCSEEEFDRS